MEIKLRTDIFESPSYWCGQLGYRPGADSIGYKDFSINRVKVDYVMSQVARGKMLDIGCAMGYLVRRLRDRGVDAWGLDISEYAISHAPEDVKPYLEVGSADKLPWSDKEFDMVVSFSTFEHLPKGIVEKAISEAVRVGKKGIIAVTPGNSPHFDEDVSHQTKQPLSWWREQFPPEFEVRSDADEKWQKTIPDVSRIPTVQMLRHDWIRSKVTLQDKICEAGCAENPVWKGTPFKVTTVDSQINPELQIFPDVKAEAEHLPFQDKSFDISVLGELLEHVPNPQQVLREAVRVAKKKVILTVPAEFLWPDELKPFWNPSHVRFYTPASLEAELQPLRLPYKIELIRNGPWAWLGAEVYCATKVLCICNLGLVRSQCLARLLTARGYSTRAAGWMPNAPVRATDKDYKWADTVISLVEDTCYPQFLASVPAECHTKIERYNIGPDKWSDPNHPELVSVLSRMIDSKVAANDATIKLNLGSFVDTIGYNWTNIDILAVQQHIPKDHKFRQWDLRRGIPYPDNSVDLVRMSHLIEHLTLEEAHNLCRELYRVLKPGGVARISTPDAKTIIRHYQSRDMSFFNAIQPPEYIQSPTEGERLSRLLFSGNYEHKAVYDEPMLKSFLEQAGFRKIQQVSPGFSLSEVMKRETVDQHSEISLVVETQR